MEKRRRHCALPSQSMTLFAGLHDRGCSTAIADTRIDFAGVAL